MPELLTQQVGLIRSDVDVDLHTQTAYLRGIIAESCLVHMCVSTQKNCWHFGGTAAPDMLPIHCTTWCKGGSCVTNAPMQELLVLQARTTVGSP
jgi:hypothetical protein